MDVIAFLGERAGVSSVGPTPDGVSTMDPGFATGLGDIAPGIIGDIGGNGSLRFGGGATASSLQTGHGAILTVAALIVALGAFHIWTRSKQA